MMKNFGAWGTSSKEKKRQAWVRTSVNIKKHYEGFEHLEDGSSCEESLCIF